jgi:hypothetical protein
MSVPPRSRGTIQSAAVPGWDLQGQCFGRRLFMRILAGPVPAIAMMLASAPAQAQTYDPNYPICLQTYGRAGNYIDCRYTSIVQCRLSASGRAAQCVTNPYFVGANSGSWKRQRL